MKERVICAAVKRGHKVWYGHRHNHALAAMNDSLSWTMSRKKITEIKPIQGFVTTTGRFVDRFEGRKIQELAGIKSASKDGYNQTGTLFSEDLY